MSSEAGMSRMSNTADILTKSFRLPPKVPQQIENVHSQEWTWRRFKNEFLNFDATDGGDGGSSNHEDSVDGGPDGGDGTGTSHQQANELFPKYLTRVQHNFFVLLLMLNTFFNIIVIIVALVNKSDSRYPGTIFLYLTSLVIFFMFFLITYNDEHLLRPKFSRSLASITVFITMMFTEYGNELLQFNHLLKNPLQRIRPIIYIIIANHILLPFVSRISSVITTIAIIGVEVGVTLYQRWNLCNNRNMVVRLIASEVLSYVYVAMFGLYMSRLLEIIIRRAFLNHIHYIKWKFNIHQEQERQEELLNSCFPKHLIDDVRKDLKDVFYEQQTRQQVPMRPFKKLYVNKYDNVTILYADIVNSVLLASKLDSNQLVETLSDLFGQFDECAERNRCLRIKLLGDCYYCVSGLPENDPNHAWNCVQMGWNMIKIINAIRKAKDIDINMRIGIHSGMVLSGIIGLHKWQFDIWSEDSLLASAMEHDGVPGFVHITGETLNLIPAEHRAECEINERRINDRIGYLITKKRKTLEQTFSTDTQIDVDERRERYREKTSKIKRPASFSTIRAARPDADQNGTLIRKYWDMKKRVNKFIDQEIEDMPLSFNKNFQNVHGINPFTLMFDRKVSTGRTVQRAKPEEDDGDDTEDGKSKTSQDQDHWKLELEYLTMPDDFFIFYLIFSLVLCVVIGVIKNLIIPKSHLNLISWAVLLATMVIIIICIGVFICRHSFKLSFWKRNLIWLVVSLFLLISSMHDLILFDHKVQSKKQIVQDSLILYDSTNCPYIWSYTICAILSMTGISIFLRINLWFKLLLRIIGLVSFLIILLNDYSLYQSVLPLIEPGKQWIINVGFDPVYSHFYYLFMAFIILTVIDRQIEYIFRLDFKLFKRLQQEQQDAKIMAETNDILLKNILPTYLVRKYMEKSLTFNSNQLYSESYDFCVVMFASIPNYYSEFYTENNLNDNGKKCLTLLNEIICDFDQLLMPTDQHPNRFFRVEKIKTIGSTYMAAAGLQPGRGSTDVGQSEEDDEFAYGSSRPQTMDAENQRETVITMIQFAMEMMKTLKTNNRDAFQDFKLKIGIAVGPLVAGIVGAGKPQYDIWGDTVNVASRMESTGVIGRIQITEQTAQILRQGDETALNFSVQPRGSVPVKGKGLVPTFLVKTEFDFKEQEITHV